MYSVDQDPEKTRKLRLARIYMPRFLSKAAEFYHDEKLTERIHNPVPIRQQRITSLTTNVTEQTKPQPEVSEEIKVEVKEEIEILNHEGDKIIIKSKPAI